MMHARLFSRLRSKTFATLKNGNSGFKIIGLASLFAIFGVGYLSRPPFELESRNAVKSPSSINIKGSKLFPERKVYNRGEVASHCNHENGIWVTFESGVYDVTEFVKIHPGGEKIMLAAGKAIDPFWQIFSIHSTAETKELLETYRIGDLLPIDQDNTAKDVVSTGLELLFANEPTRDPSLTVHSSRPCNAEASMNSLSTYITPNEKFYVRNHLPVPKIDIDHFKVEIEGYYCFYYLTCVILVLESRKGQAIRSQSLRRIFKAFQWMLLCSVQVIKERKCIMLSMLRGFSETYRLQFGLVFACSTS